MLINAILLKKLFCDFVKSLKIFRFGLLRMFSETKAPWFSGHGLSISLLNDMD